MFKRGINKAENARNILLDLEVMFDRLKSMFRQNSEISQERFYVSVVNVVIFVWQMKECAQCNAGLSFNVWYFKINVISQKSEILEEPLYVS